MVYELTTPRVMFLQRVTSACDAAVPVQPSTREGPIFIGDGFLNCVCPSCLRVLCESVAPKDLAGVVVLCGCGNLGCVPLDRPADLHALSSR